MAEDPARRRLAAILATDVGGYSRPIGGLAGPPSPPLHHNTTRSQAGPGDLDGHLVLLKICAMLALLSRAT